MPAEQTHESERFQELAAFIAAVLLVLTLVAAIYGANIYVPGKDRVTGLLIMLGAMVVTALATGLLPRPLVDRPPTHNEHRELPPPRETESVI